MRRLLPLLLIIAFPSCLLRNDLDYPVVPGDILTFTVEGQKGVVINAQARTVVVDLEETADASRLKVTEVSVSPDARIEGIGEYIDLSKPLEVSVNTWQEYKWTISSTQTIDRYVRCSGQIGDAKFNPDTKTVIVSVLESQPLTKITIEDMKLEPEGSMVHSTTGYSMEGNKATVSTLPCNFPMTLDCVLERTFSVIYKGETIVWRFKAVQVAMSLSIDSVVPYCYHAKVRALFDGGAEPVMEYRAADASEWAPVTATVAGVGLSADITGLSEDTAYEVRLRRGDETSEAFSFRTGKPEVLHNMNFDLWYQDGKCWYANESSSFNIWDSANPGTSSLGVVPTTPETTDVAVSGPGKKAARLESTTAFGQFAAGNIYVGQFVQVAGLGAILNWGVPFSGRPSALEGYYKYAPKPVDKAKEPYLDEIGKPDHCSIKIYLTDWTSQFVINTSKKQFLSESDPSIIGMASLVSDKADESYVKFTLPIEYRDNRTPSYIVIACAASRYGDYFTGGIGSVLLVDEFSFVYE